MSPSAYVLSEVKGSLIQLLVRASWACKEKIQNKKSPRTLSRQFALTHQTTRRINEIHLYRLETQPQTDR